MSGLEAAMLVGVGKDTARHDRLATAATKHRQSIDDTDSDADERALKAQAPRSLQSGRLKPRILCQDRLGANIRKSQKRTRKHAQTASGAQAPA